MSKQLILNNLFRQPDNKRYGRIVKPLSGNRYQVVDSQGRSEEVSSSVKWSVSSGVEIKDGRIVGKASPDMVQKIYQV
jgi:hypothetical protein